MGILWCSVDSIQYSVVSGQWSVFSGLWSSGLIKQRLNLPGDIWQKPATNKKPGPDKQAPGNPVNYGNKKEGNASMSRQVTLDLTLIN